MNNKQILTLSEFLKICFSNRKLSLSVFLAIVILFYIQQFTKQELYETKILFKYPTYTQLDTVNQASWINYAFLDIGSTKLDNKNFLYLLPNTIKNIIEKNSIKYNISNDSGAYISVIQLIINDKDALIKLTDKTVQELTIYSQNQTEKWEASVDKLIELQKQRKNILSNVLYENTIDSDNILDGIQYVNSYKDYIQANNAIETLNFSLQTLDDAEIDHTLNKVNVNYWLIFIKGLIIAFIGTIFIMLFIQYFRDRLSI